MNEKNKNILALGNNITIIDQQNSESTDCFKGTIHSIGRDVQHTLSIGDSIYYTSSIRIEEDLWVVLEEDLLAINICDVSDINIDTQ